MKPVCEINNDRKHEFSEDDADKISYQCDQVMFLQKLNLLPATNNHNVESSQEIHCNYDILKFATGDLPKSPNTPRRKSLISQLSRHHNINGTVDEGVGDLEPLTTYEESDNVAYQSRNVSSLLNIPLSSPLGLRLQNDIIRLTSRADSINYQDNLNYEEFCRTPKKTLNDRLRDRISGAYPITFRRRKCFGAYHFYAFSNSDKIEAKKRYKTGLNAASRSLLRLLTRCSVKLKRLSAKEIEELTRRKPVQLFSYFNEHLANQPLKKLQDSGKVKNGFIRGKSARKSLSSFTNGHCKKLCVKVPKVLDKKTKVKQLLNDISDSSSDDDVMITGIVPPPNGNTRQLSRSLQFRCHMCGVEMMCYADFNNLVSRHFAAVHGVYNISLVQEVDKSGQTVYTIVQNKSSQLSENKKVQVSSTSCQSSNSVQSWVKVPQQNSLQVNGFAHEEIICLD